MKRKWKNLIAGFICGIVICTNTGLERVVLAQEMENIPEMEAAQDISTSEEIQETKAVDANENVDMELDGDADGAEDEGGIVENNDQNPEKDAEDAKYTFKSIKDKTVEKNEILLGDYIYLGSYYNQPILWRCVDKDENGLLMLSDRILCFKAYDASGEDNYYHNDSWGYIRKQYGSNCWEDSSIRQWLNSNSDTVAYSHCPPSAERVYDGYNPYDTESGFLNNFSGDEQDCIKQVTRVINVNAYEVDRDGYCDGGSESIDCRSIYDYPLDTDYTKFFYRRCSDKIFLMDARQIRRVYNNFEDYIYAYPTEEAVQNNDEKSSEITSSMICQYRLNVPGTIGGASFEHVETVPANQLNPKGAYASSGIRPAFYLNESLFSGEVFKEKPFSIKDFSIDQTAMGSVNELVRISGLISLTDDSKLSETVLDSKIKSIQWTSSDQGIVQDSEISCLGINFYDNRSAEMMIYFTPHKEGTVTITGTASNGKTASCDLTITEPEVPEKNYTADYSEDMTDFLTSRGTLNTLKYLCKDSNFTNSIFVHQNDQKFGAQVELVLTDMLYRGLDGWKDLFTAGTSVEDAEKILVALLQSYQADCENLAKVKTAQKLAKVTIDAFNDYLRDSAIGSMVNEDEMKILQHKMDEGYVIDKLMNKEYDQLIKDLIRENDAKFNEDVRAELDGFMKSKELADSLSVGLDIFEKGVKILSFTQDTVNKLYEVESLLTADEMYCEMLLYLKENCICEVVQEAAGNVYDIVNGGMDAVVKEFAGSVGEWVLEKGMGKALDIALKSCPVAEIVKNGFDWGVTITNTFLHTGDIQKLKDSMRSEAYIGNCLSMWALRNYQDFYDTIGTSEQNEAAKRLYYSLYMLWQTRAEGEKTLQSMMTKQGTRWSEYYTVSMKVSKALDSMKDSVFTQKRTEALLGITVSCPVDVEVYDNAGKLLVTAKDGEESSGFAEGVYYYVCYQPFENDYVKYIYFPENSGCSVKYTGNDQGLVDCSISSISDTGIMEERYFENIHVVKGTTISIDNVTPNTRTFIVTDPDTNEMESHSFDKRGTDYIPVEEIILSENECKIKAGSQKMITATVMPANASSKKAVWSSDDESVVTVNSDGVVTAVAVGTAKITSAIEEVTAACIVTVTSADEDVPPVDIPSGDILKDDLPADGQIPAGLWIANLQDNYLYTGKAIKPAVRVYDHDKRLKAGRDYTVSYKNNTKVNDTSQPSKTPAVVVKGKGDYTGTETAAFNILPVELDTMTAEDITVAYNKKVQKKIPVLYYNGRKLSKNKDFTVSWPDQGTDAYKAAGTYRVALTGTGNFTGTKSIQITITDKNLISKAAVGKIAPLPYTGDAQEPELTVTVKGAALVRGTDYEVEYTDNVSAGTATAVLTGINQYAGTKKVNFKITGTSLKGISVTGLEDTVYNGEAQIPPIKVTLNGKSLAEHEDYEISCSKNINAGKAAVTIRGIHAYTGVIKKTFNIMPYDLERMKEQIQGTITAKYRKGGCKPAPELVFAEKKLTAGKDYTISYKNHKAVTASGGRMPVMVIKGKGNFRGTLSKEFTITNKALDDPESLVTLTVADVPFSDKAGKYISKPILTDADGKKLTAGKDYEDIVYTLEDGTILSNKDKLDAGTEVKVSVKGKGAYTGELNGAYRITVSDFAKAKASISAQAYTGREITLKSDDVTVKVDGILLIYGEDYEIIEGSYSNHIKKGKATVRIKGKGNYGGIKTAEFKITAKQFVWFWRMFR